MLRRRWPRADSLFTRLLLTQIALALALGLIVGTLFYVERNVTVALLYADRWAPQLAAAAGLAAAPSAPVPVLRRDAPPPSSRRTTRGAPRFVALRRALLGRGIPVDEVRLSVDEQPMSMVWLHVVPADGPAQWLGVPGEIVVPEWSRRTLLALLLAGGLLLGVSWAFTRRLTRPLERLRERMQTHVPGQTGDLGELPGGSSEVAAIGAAYADLIGRLQQHERERALLLAGVSHDLRSPLGRIRMAAELLPDGADVATRKASIVRNVGEADRLIESFLDFVRSGELPCDETVDLAAAARAVVAGFDRPADELRLDAPVALAWPRANRLLVERLIANLVDNAFKHGRPPVRLRLAVDAGQATIEVEDSGAGIAPDEAGRLQQAFARGDHSRGASGSGLGLAIVRQAALRLGGSLAFERGERGQRVRVVLMQPAGNMHGRGRGH